MGYLGVPGIRGNWLCRGYVGIMHELWRVIGIMYTLLR